MSPTTFGKTLGPTRALSPASGAEQPTRDAAQVVRLGLHWQAGASDDPTTIGDPKAAAAPGLSPLTELDHQMGSKPGEATKATGRRPDRKQRRVDQASKANTKEGHDLQQHLMDAGGSCATFNAIGI